MVPGKKENIGPGGGLIVDYDNMVEQTLHYMESNDPSVIAAFLRGLAEKLSPAPKPSIHYRGTE